jgi:MFS family permease
MTSRVASASLPPPEKKRALSVSVLDGMLHAVMLGTSESYLGALAVELGHAASGLALLASVPLLIGALVQLASGALSAWLGAPKRLVVLGAGLQAASHLGLIWIAESREAGLLPLLAIKTLFWASGTLIAPAWGAWMASLSDGRARERYFALRSAAVYAALLISFMGGGALLQASTAQGRLETFAVLFWVACAARSASTLALSLQPARAPASQHDASFAHQRLMRALREGQWRTSLYLAALMFGVYVSVPFFTPYMLRELELDYATYVMLTSVSILAKACTFPFCHRIAERFGLRALLIASGVGIALLPALWAELTSVAWLVGVELLGGAVWAGLEYASFQLLLAGAKDAFRVEFLAVSGAVTGAAQLSGSYLGAQLLTTIPNGYTAVFWLSTFLRAVSLVLLVSALPRLVPLGGALIRLVTRLMSVRPNAGAVQRPVIADDPEDDD